MRAMGSQPRAPGTVMAAKCSAAPAAPWAVMDTREFSGESRDIGSSLILAVSCPSGARPWVWGVSADVALETPVLGGAGC